MATMIDISKFICLSLICTFWTRLLTIIYQLIDKDCVRNIIGKNSMFSNFHRKIEQFPLIFPSKIQNEEHTKTIFSGICLTQWKPNFGDPWCISYVFRWNF